MVSRVAKMIRAFLFLFQGRVPRRLYTAKRHDHEPMRNIFHSEILKRMLQDFKKFYCFLTILDCPTVLQSSLSRIKCQEFLASILLTSIRARYLYAKYELTIYSKVIIVSENLNLLYTSLYMQL